MADADDPRKAAARQVKQRLASLRAAGIDYLPANPPVPLIPAEGATEPAGASPLPPVPTDHAPGPISVPAGASLFGGAEAAPDDPAARRQALALLAEEVSGCPRCAELYATRTQTVFGVGPVGADICFVGEAPGAEEDRTGEPFVGAAGQLLNKIIAACGFRRDEVYICNTIKCRPPNNREPTLEEKANCRGYFDRQLDLVKPKFICCLGGVAAKSVLNTPIGITKLRGRFHQFRGIPVLCTFHPAYLLRNPDAKKDCWEDMKLLLKQMGRPVPGTRQG